jgi:hypothetical protein
MIRFTPTTTIPTSRFDHFARTALVVCGGAGINFTDHEHKPTTMKPHPHAALMRQYADDADETDRPWERWQVRFPHAQTWAELGCQSPTWCSDYEYRRKPRTININGIEVPEPVREPLEESEPYYLAQADSDYLPKIHWSNCPSDQRWLRYGIIHLTREAAETHARALRSFTEREEGEV